MSFHEGWLRHLLFVEAKETKTLSKPRPPPTERVSLILYEIDREMHVDWYAHESPCLEDR